jgi:serine/threonine protein kinase
VHDLPCVDPCYNPPETALPTEAVDIYQIGVVLSCLCRLEEQPSHDSILAYEQQDPDSAYYSADLRELISTLLNPIAGERPSPSDLIKSALVSRGTLRAKGLLPHTELLIADIF